MKRNTCAVVRTTHCYYCLSVACSHSLSPGSTCHWLFVEKQPWETFQAFSNFVPGWPWRCLPVAPLLTRPGLSPEDWDVKPIILVMSIIDIVVMVINTRVIDIMVINTRVKVMLLLIFTLSASAILSSAGNSASSTLTFSRLLVFSHLIISDSYRFFVFFFYCSCGICLSYNVSTFGTPLHGTCSPTRPWSG